MDKELKEIVDGQEEMLKTYGLENEVKNFKDEISGINDDTHDGFMAILAVCQKYYEKVVEKQNSEKKKSDGFTEIIKKFGKNHTKEISLSREDNAILNKIAKETMESEDLEELCIEDDGFYSFYTFKGGVYVIVCETIDTDLDSFSEEFQKKASEILMNY